MEDEVKATIQEIKETEDFFQKAKLIDYLQKTKNLSTKRLSDALEMKPAYLCHIARLNKLPELVIDGYYSKLISVSHLFIIARLKEQQEMIDVYEKALSEGLTVIKTEEVVREHLYSIKSEGSYVSKEEITAAKNRVKRIDPSVDLKVIQTRVKGRVQLEIKGSLKHTTEVIQKILSKFD
jgi:hypothetical protein